MRSQFPHPSHRQFRRSRLAILAILTALCCMLLPALVTTAVASSHIHSQIDLPVQLDNSLEQQGRAAYEAGDYQAAVDVFQQLANQYMAQDQPVGAALAFANLSLSYQQLGQWSAASTTIDTALELVPAADDAPPSVWASRGQVLSAQGQLLVAQGNTNEAEMTWAAAAIAYAQGEQPRQSVQAQVNQARTLLAAGFYSRALGLAQVTLTEQPDDAVTVDALRLYGDLLRLTGQLDQAAEQLTLALELAKQVAPTAVSRIYTSLGTLAEAQGDDDAALMSYQLATEATDQQPGLAAQVNQLKVLVKRSEWDAIATVLPPLVNQLQTQPPNRETIYTRITFGQTLLTLRQAVDQALDNAVAQENESELTPLEELPLDTTITSDNTAVTPEVISETSLTGTQQAGLEPLLGVVERLPSGDAIATLLLETYAAADTLGDIKAQTYTLSTLGQLYTQTQQWDIAKQQTLTALKLAQSANLYDVEYQLQEQLCQILQNTDTTETSQTEAIKACRAAVNTTNLLRKDIAAKGADASFNFQQKVEPIYREFIDLLLRTEQTDANYENNLKEARQVLESLQLAELDNFFREACLELQSVDLDSVADATTAVIYPIILPDRLEIIVSFADKISRYTTLVSEAELKAAITIWGAGVRDQFSAAPHRASAKQSSVKQSEFTPTLPIPAFVDDIGPSSQQLYQWLMAPMEDDLQQAGVDTLVFVLDGSLRNVSMAALYDGDQYLVEKYAIALTPGLQLIDPKPIARDEIKAFLAGVSKAQEVFLPQFGPLTGVETELESIKGVVESDTLLNEEVTNEALEYGIATSSAPIVHIATHGKFGEKPEDTFILTWGNTLNVNQLSQLLKTSELSRTRELELLILSACETADGDERAVLGLAGVATRSGARSTLATLWAVDDDSTSELMGEFYQQLVQMNIDKAKALQQAQLEILNNPSTSHPYYWSPFILLGNWL